VHINCCDASQHPILRNSTIGKANRTVGFFISSILHKGNFHDSKNQVVEYDRVGSFLSLDAIKNNVVIRDVSNTWEVKLITIHVEIRDKIINIPAKGMDKRSKNAVCTCEKRPHVKFCIFHKTFLH
jgi:hypothetical protein